MTTGKTIALTIRIFVGKVMSLPFNMLPRFVIAFIPRNKCLLILWLQSLSTLVLEPKKIKSVTVSTFSPSICHEVLGPDARIFGVFLMLSLSQLFHSSLSHSSRGSLVPLSAIGAVSSTYPRLLIFLLAILIPACASPSLAFHVMYSEFVK